MTGVSAAVVGVSLSVRPGEYDKERSGLGLTTRTDET